MALLYVFEKWGPGSDTWRIPWLEDGDKWMEGSTFHVDCVQCIWAGQSGGFGVLIILLVVSVMIYTYFQSLFKWRVLNSMFLTTGFQPVQLVFYLHHNHSNREDTIHKLKDLN